MNDRDDNRSRLDALRDLFARPESARARWWTTFAFVTALCTIWMIATPLFAAPDEPAHLIRAASVARGQLLGDEVEGSEGLSVDAPAIYGNSAATVGCFAFYANRSAACASFAGPSELTGMITTAGRHPPAYYAVAGVPTIVFPDAIGAYLARAISALVTAAFVATALTALDRLASRRIARLGLLLAVTPMVLFVGAVVNPSALEVPAALALWACGGVLALGTGPLDARLVRAAGIASIVFVLSRQLAPLWLAVTLLTLAALAGRERLRALWDSAQARRWGIAVSVATLLQVAWVVVVKPLDPSLGRQSAIEGISTLSAFRTSLGETIHRYQEMIGSFGWLDTPSPELVYGLWTLALGGLATLAIVLGRRRVAAAAGAIAAVVVLAPIGFETTQAESAGFFWQGRYSMPLAIGIPVLLALSLAVEAKPVRLNRYVVAVGAAVFVSHVLAFWQAVRRNTVGIDGPLDFPFDPEWSPPLPAWLLLILYLLVTAPFVVWLVGPNAEREPTPIARVAA